ncbi:PrgI family protein [Peptoniphilus rhinitidis]|uniref:PrgI family protein n=1 Tax=Peptoniphilus rhinitidis TaxID=1175452 RepID=UPI00028A082A|nr:PrgI family protein [Peptoniphilus rhinitidis]
MLIVPVPNDMKAYKPRVLGRYTVRQVGCISGAIALSVLEVFILKSFMTITDMSYVIIFSCIPFALFGFFNKNGKNFEQWLKVMFQFKFGVQKLPYRITLKQLENPMIQDDTFIQVDFNKSSRFDRATGERIPELTEDDSRENRLKLWMNPIGSFSNLAKEGAKWEGPINGSILTKEYKIKRNKDKEAGFKKEWNIGTI